MSTETEVERVWAGSRYYLVGSFAGEVELGLPSMIMNLDFIPSVVGSHSGKWACDVSYLFLTGSSH